MIYWKRVSEVPGDIRAQLCDKRRPWWPMFRTTVHMSPVVCIVYDDETPLMAIGAFRGTLLQPECELWMARTTHFNIGYAKEVVELFRDFLANHWPQHLSMFARAESSLPSVGKFIRLFGGRLEMNDNGAEIYRMFP